MATASSIAVSGVPEEGPTQPAAGAPDPTTVSDVGLSGVGLVTTRSELQFQDDRLCIVSAGNELSGGVLVATCFAMPTTSQLRSLDRLTARLKSEHPTQRQVLLMSVLTEHPRFDEAVRREILRQAASCQHRVATALVLTVGGLRGVAHRAVLAHRLAAEGRRLGAAVAPLQVFGDDAAACRFLVGKLYVDATPERAPARFEAERLVELRKETMARSRRSFRPRYF